MQYSLKLAGFYLKPGSAEEMFYTDDNGELFIGRVKDVDIGRTYLIEVGEKRLGSCFRYIMKWLDDDEIPSNKNKSAGGEET
jgi:hypothetical protein